uniref:Uncharacterized protein n=1 Tax=Mycetohabitans endofungorum TaxID=417203 RepID=A0A6B9HCS0_9BURK|nr:hypothetical protein [Mycetohabitans endofungorum]
MVTGGGFCCGGHAAPIGVKYLTANWPFGARYAASILSAKAIL